jgi:hypothetical protein
MSVGSHLNSNNSVNLSSLTSVTNLHVAYNSPTPSPHKKHTSDTPYSPRELGKLADDFALELGQTVWEGFICQKQRPHSVNPSIHHIRHPLRQYLHRLACTGVPVAMHTPPWSPTRRDAAYLQGAHLSATVQYRPFLHADIYDYIRMGYWTVLP